MTKFVKHPKILPIGTYLSIPNSRFIWRITDLSKDETKYTVERIDTMGISKEIPTNRVSKTNVIDPEFVKEV